MPPRGPHAFAADTRGVAAIEFALLAPAFIMLLVGTISLSIMIFNTSSLQYATQVAARCASVHTLTCRDATTTTAYAAANYFGASTAPSFTCTGRSCGGTAGCGNKVTGEVDYTLDVGIQRFVKVLRATACFP